MAKAILPITKLKRDFFFKLRLNRSKKLIGIVVTHIQSNSNHVSFTYPITTKTELSPVNFKINV